jgi:hypothetical protein
MRTSFRLAAVTLVIAAGLSASGCAPDAPEPKPAPSPSVTPLFATDEEALAAAEQAYAAYVAVTDRVFMDGATDLSSLDTVATGKQLEIDRSGLTSAAEKGYRSRGTTTFEDVTLQSYSPDSSSGIAVVVVYLCEDVSSVDVVDSAGISVVAPDRPDRVRYEVTFDRAAKNRTLLVAFREPWAGGSC